MNNRNSGITLRPWEEVAAMFTKNTGERMTKNNAWMIARNAERKLVTRLAHAGVTPKGEIEMPSSKYTRWTNKEIAADVVQSMNGTLDRPANLVLFGVSVASDHPTADAKAIKQAIVELLAELRPEVA